MLKIHMMKAFRRNKPRISTLDDIVFENRNKGYGSYYIRSSYKRRLLFSFLLVLFVFVFITLFVYFWKINPLIEISNGIDNSLYESVMYNPEMIPMLIRLPDAPKEKPVAVIVKTEPVITTDQQQLPENKVEMPLVKFNPLPPAKPDTAVDKLAEMLLKRHKDLLKEKPAKTDTIKLVLDKAPQFPGGNGAIQYYFHRNQKYPVNALVAGIHGSTIVSFVINEKGMVINVKVVSGIDPELDMEAIRLVKSMPQWQPAYYKGKPISCMLVIPVDFGIR